MLPFLAGGDDESAGGKGVPLDTPDPRDRWVASDVESEPDKERIPLIPKTDADKNSVVATPRRSSDATWLPPETLRHISKFAMSAATFGEEGKVEKLKPSDRLSHQICSINWIYITLGFSFFILRVSVAFRNLKN